MVGSNQSWQSIAQARQQHLAHTIAEVKPSVPDIPEKLPLNITSLPRTLLSPECVSITERPAEQLVSELADGKLSSLAVTQAFLQRAALASKLTNCLTEVLTSRALERAHFLDHYYETHKKPIGPLHGLPISVKEHVSMKGLDLNAGFIAWVGRIGEDDALILKLLWKAGCVFHARTTEPQTLMHLETSSNVHGVTVNPFNANLTSGGSSGGEGSLLGQRGSCLGIGSDIGGSIRSPAANNGVFGLRPTSYRLPLGSLMATMLGEEHIVPVVGPLSTSLDGIKLFMKTLIDQEPWLYEAMLLPLPWKTPSPPASSLLRRDAAGHRRLRIGLLPDDGIVRPHPPVRRAFAHVVAQLRAHASTFELVDFPPYRHADAWRIVSSLYFADGGAEERAAIDAAAEPWRPLSRFILLDNPNVRARTVPEVWGLTIERDAYRDAYARHWNSVGTRLAGPEDGAPLEVDADAEHERMVDVLLCPVGPGCAPPLDCARYWAYTSQWNLLDYPALVFPTGLACSTEDEADVNYQPRNEQDAYNYNLYDPEVYIDAPISLQLVGRRYEDEKLIEALELIIETTKLKTNLVAE